MLSSHKVFYLVVISMLIICTAMGISVQGSNTYVVVPASEHHGSENTDFIQDLFVDDEDSGVHDSNHDGSDSTSMDVDIDEDETQTSSTYDIEQGGISELESEPTTSASQAPSSESTAQTSQQPNTTQQPQQPTTTTTQQTQAPSNQNTTTTTAATVTTTTTVYTTTTTTTQYIAPTTEYVPPTTQYTPPTTQYVAPTTTNYSNSGRISFSATPGGATITEYRLYVGNNAKLYLNTAFGETPIASYFSDNTSIVSIGSNEVGTAVVTANNAGSTWVHAYNSNGSECHCKIDVVTFEQQVVYLCNQYRRASGLPDLEVGPSQLYEVAKKRRDEIHSTWSHTRPNGTKFSTAYPECGITSGKFGENLARGEMYTPEEVVEAWMNSTSHRANIMNGQFKYCSVAYDAGQLSGKTCMFWSQQFYTPYY